MPTTRRPSLLATLFNRPPRGPVPGWDAGGVMSWAARAGLPRGAAKRVLTGRDGEGLLGLPYAAVAGAAASPAEADCVWRALGDLKARAAAGAGLKARQRLGTTSPASSPDRGRAGPAPSIPSHHPPTPLTPLTPDHLGGVDPAALKSALATWASFGAPRTLAEAATASRSLSRGLDGRAWAKLCRDCGLLMAGALDAAGADLIFKKAVAGAPGGGGAAAPRAAWGCGVGGFRGTAQAPPRRLDYATTLAALRSVAAHSRRPLGCVLRSVVAGEPALLNTTTPDAWVKWHDDRDAWTGAC
jgi:hypothetical protein